MRKDAQTFLRGAAPYPQVQERHRRGRVGCRSVVVMTMSPVEIERKVRQLDNDVQSIYEMLAAIQGTQQRHSNRFQEITEKLDTVDQTVNTLDGKVGALDQKVDTLDGKVGALNGKVGALDQKVDTLDGKMDTVLELLR